MSASLDDMPEYEHFQDELDLELVRYQKIQGLTEMYAEHAFIQHVCFILFLRNPQELSSVILSHILSALPESKQRIINFLRFANSDKDSFLKDRFSEVLSSYTD